MKVISLLQPWASLVAMGAKKIETRSRNTSLRGEFLVHASLGKKYGNISCRELCYESPFNHFIDNGIGYDKLPFGAIIGKATLVETAKMDDIIMYSSVTSKGITWELSGDELSFGDFSEGRYAYLLSDIIMFKKAIPAKGKQMIPWELDIDISSCI